MRLFWLIIQGLFALLGRVASHFLPSLSRFTQKLKDVEKPVDKGFVGDAEYAMHQQEPLRARTLLRTFAMVLGLFVMWASVTTVDEVTRGEGRVIPSRQVQVLQSVDGGVVEEILVREGDIVEPGDILLRVDPTRFVSSVRESKVQAEALEAKIARLRALAEGKDFVIPTEVSLKVPQIVAEEQILYESKKRELGTSISIARQQLLQRQQELNEAQAQRSSAIQGYDLTNRELEVTRRLVSSGAVSEVELLRLERDAARFRGERDQARAAVARTGSAISEARRKIEEIELNFRNNARTELNETLAKFNSLTEGSVALQDKVTRSEIRSQVRGTVKTLHTNTVGGVVQPGKEVIEIVPLEDNLLLETKILPKDIAFLRPGQKAVVKFTAYDFSIFGGLDGSLETIGADTITDPKGNAFYLVKVRTQESSLGENLPIIPGMVANVDIHTGKKTILTYLLKPLLRAKGYAFSER